MEDSIKDVSHKFDHMMVQILNKKTEEMNFLNNAFVLNHPDKRIKKGFVQTTKNNHIIDLEELKIDDIVVLENTNLVVETKVLQIKSLK
jgi:exodeoxyribonuclease VII large subunit